MNADIFKWGCIAIKRHVVYQKMKHFNHQHNYKMSNFYLSSINVLLHGFTVDIMADTFESELHITKHGYIHQHVLKQ